MTEKIERGDYFLSSRTARPFAHLGGSFGRSAALEFSVDSPAGNREADAGEGCGLPRAHLRRTPAPRTGGSVIAVHLVGFAVQVKGAGIAAVQMSQ